MAVLPTLTTEKTFRRLLTSTEKHVEENSIEDWKLDQVKNYKYNSYIQCLFLLNYSNLVCQSINRNVEQYAKISEVIFRFLFEILEKKCCIVIHYSRPSSAQLDEYKQRIDNLRKSIDLTKLVSVNFCLKYYHSFNNLLLFQNRKFSNINP